MDWDKISQDDEKTYISSAEAKRLIRAAVSEALLRRSRVPRPYKVFGMSASKSYAERVCRHLEHDLTPHDERLFSDGELYCKPTSRDLGNVRGHNVFVIQSLYSDDLAVSSSRLKQIEGNFVDDTDTHCILSRYTQMITDLSGETAADKFMKLAVMCGALRDASAHEITVIIPHMAWARQDRKTESRAPITTKYIAQILESLGVHRVLMIDVHNLAAEQNAFRIPVDNLETKNLHARWCTERLKGHMPRKLRVLTPDAGGLGRATRFRNALAKVLGAEYEDDIQLCIFDKVRESGRVVGGRIIGDVEDAEVIGYDDIISTGSTMEKACHAVIRSGGRMFAICAAHGLFCGDANRVFDQFDVPVVIADTVEPFRLSKTNIAKISRIDTTGMVADAIVRIHSGTGSLSELLEAN